MKLSPKECRIQLTVLPTLACFRRLAQPHFALDWLIGKAGAIIAPGQEQAIAG